VRIRCTLVNVGTKKSIAFISWITSTLDARIGRFASGINSTSAKLGDGFFAMIYRLTDVTVSNITLFARATKSGLLILTKGVRRARFGSTAWLAALVNVNTRYAISFVAGLTSAADTRIERSTNSVLVALSVFFGFLQTMVDTLGVFTIGIAVETVSSIALIASTLDARE